MSYILDALKKSQQEREQRQSPPGTMPSGFQPVFAEEKNSAHRPMWLWLIIALLMAVAALLVLLLLSVRENTALSSSVNTPEVFSADAESSVKAAAENETQLKASRPPVTVQTPAVARSEVEKNTTETKAAKPSSNPVSQPASTQVNTSPVPETPVSVAKPDPEESLKTVQEEPAVALEQTPPYQVLKSIPDLEITGHLYSTLADKRYVNMNGRVWHEGDYISDQIRITSITPEGLILDAGGWKIAVGRSQGWQAIR